jgi:RHH-type transcriptional regulator, rel operon repressor / antitoxin RelB
MQTNEMEFAVRLLNSIRLDKALDARLSRLARLTGRSKSYYVNRALEEQIQVFEHRYSARRLTRHVTDGPERILPLYELECALGADD